MHGRVGGSETDAARPGRHAQPDADADREPGPDRPAAMDEVSTDGAIAAATYFLQLYPYAYNTGDLTEWKALSHPECMFCASVVDNVTAMHEQGHRSEGARSPFSSRAELR